MIRMKIGFTVWICDESHSIPKRCRSIDFPPARSRRKNSAAKAPRKSPQTAPGYRMFTDNLTGLLVENLRAHMLLSVPTGGNVDEFLAAQPKENRGDGHENARQTKGDVGAVQTRAFQESAQPPAEAWLNPADGLVRLEQPRNQQGGNGRAGVDRKIKPVKNAREQMLVRFAELVAHVGRDTRLDSTRADRDQGSPIARR